MIKNLNAKQIQILAQAVQLIDFERLFAYFFAYGYDIDSAYRSWMIAKAIQTLAGGELCDVMLDLSPKAPDPYRIGTVVRFRENAFMDGSGLYTTDELLERWTYIETTDGKERIVPLVFRPNLLEGYPEVVETIAQQFRNQLKALEGRQKEFEEPSSRPSAPASAEDRNRFLRGVKHHVYWRDNGGPWFITTSGG